MVKQLRRLDTALKQEAEIALYLKQYNEAEAVYRRMDRPDLAIDMRMRLGEWFAVSPQPAYSQTYMFVHMCDTYICTCV